MFVFQVWCHGSAFSSDSQEAMERVEGNILHDKEGIDIKEEIDHGHELDDEERKALEEIIKQPHVSSPPLQEHGTCWLWHTGIRILLQQQPKSCFFPRAEA